MGGGKFTDGLLLGAILGGTAVFLLGTNRGNKVLKVLSEEGTAKLNEIIDEIEEAKREAEEIGEDDVSDDFEEMVVETPPKTNGASHSQTEEKTKSTKRFFKKAK